MSPVEGFLHWNYTGYYFTFLAVLFLAIVSKNILLEDIFVGSFTCVCFLPPANLRFTTVLGHIFISMPYLCLTF